MEKKNQKKGTNKIMKTIKMLTVLLIIVLISMIGFVGIFVQNKGKISNIIKDYSYSMALDGARTVKLSIHNHDEEESVEENNESENTEEVEETAKDEEKPTIENFKNSKKVIEKRLKALGVEEYSIRLNEENGEIQIELPENSDTDAVVSAISQVGKFEIIDTNTQEVLMTNADIKSSDVLYNTTESGTTAYLQIKFTSEGKDKLEEITKTYVKSEETTDSEKETTETSEEVSEDATEESNNEKTITMKIDDEDIMTTSFNETIENGEIDLTVGTATSDADTLKKYIEQAKNTAVLLDNGKMEVDYELAGNQYILATITEKQLTCVAIGVAVLACVGIIVLVVRYKTNGLLAGISFIGLVAVYNLIIKYTNVVISIESVVGIITMITLNYLFISMLLKNLKQNINRERAVSKAVAETYKKFFLRIIPVCITVIAFCFVKWVPINSFAMASLWGIITLALYNTIFTRILLSIKEGDK